MTITLFNNCKADFHRISEAIQLHNTGRHCEYDKDNLDEQLDIVHRELCDACSDFATDLITLVKEGHPVGQKAKEWLTALYYWALECRDYGDNPESCELEDSYGSGRLDSIGADFYVYYGFRNYHCYGYREFAELLENYGLLAY